MSEIAEERLNEQCTSYPTSYEQVNIGLITCERILERNLGRIVTFSRQG